MTQLYLTGSSNCFFSSSLSAFNRSCFVFPLTSRDRMSWKVITLILNNRLFRVIMQYKSVNHNQLDFRDRFETSINLFKSFSITNTTATIPLPLSIVLTERMNSLTKQSSDVSSSSLLVASTVYTWTIVSFNAFFLAAEEHYSKWTYIDRKNIEKYDRVQ